MSPFRIRVKRKKKKLTFSKKRKKLKELKELKELTLVRSLRKSYLLI